MRRYGVMHINIEDWRKEKNESVEKEKKWKCHNHCDSDDKVSSRRDRASRKTVSPFKHASLCSLKQMEMFKSIHLLSLLCVMMCKTKDSPPSESVSSFLY